jgi:hypothetical protein
VVYGIQYTSLERTSMPANSDELDHLAKRLSQIAQTFREYGMASTGAEEGICELRREAE